MSTIHRPDLLVLLATRPPMTRPLPPFTLTKVFYPVKTPSPQTTEKSSWRTFLHILDLLTDLAATFADLMVAVKDFIGAYEELKDTLNPEGRDRQRRNSHRRRLSSNQQTSVIIIHNISASSQQHSIFPSCPYECCTSISRCWRCENAAR